MTLVASSVRHLPYKSFQKKWILSFFLLNFVGSKSLFRVKVSERFISKFVCVDFRLQQLGRIPRVIIRWTCRSESSSWCWCLWHISKHHLKMINKQLDWFTQITGHNSLWPSDFSKNIIESIFIRYNVWDEITYPFLNFNGATVAV